ncbi:2-polyprenyl-6-methoxyphenol hydroxylase [Modestobacter sp. DSM 44400]|uniref:NAD(P)/FAD-dependent oxidoreductase n=1 Tax=Modestobacter sp. DSM 44400 TaxID=1550230 RepID=UPI00089628EA|nr:FAD-dependent oxidoreductase [Modestobacter sp. DSM 44400]SDY94182.1 2-polyprenyl-6-methoxyphenol hydroxylase [Modestobacter sp. DSM 44400]
MTETTTDVAIVGGGIAGGALAVQLARAGLGVTVLEQSEHFRDRVRGEYMPPWGYAELVSAGLLDVVLRAEGTVTPRFVTYGDSMSPDDAEAAAADTSRLVRGAAGMLNLSHPGACSELADEAARNGAEVVRGVHRVEVAAGSRPAVTYLRGDQEHVLRARVVVGADGRSSAVRRQLGVRLATTGPRTFAVGLLVDGLTGWPAATNAVGTCQDVCFFVFPRRDGRARVYLVWDKSAPGRFAGPGAGERILSRLATLTCFPDGDVFRAARPGPGWASYPLGDAWTDQPYAPGAVLIGDAAGYNDPILGQGLTIAVRDARLVAEALLSGGQWGPSVFAPYAAERTERMRRLRATADAMTRLRADFTAEGRRRRDAAFARFAADPGARLPIAAAMVGPDALPPEAFTREAADRMVALP